MSSSFEKEPVTGFVMELVAELVAELEAELVAEFNVIDSAIPKSIVVGPAGRVVNFEPA
ncbi:hypothetical protein MsAm2_00010 [Methanolapillus ohkumae]|uniref:Uncharacterized protein n=1 Tax=Methanolapillus ohkumae TaxID=3028298 RepID=A0AA96ZW71_9EURY|nr:hypothetical protein MsAm2_00010 [Methanosarcinaceae archaeon Am2]